MTDNRIRFLYAMGYALQHGCYAKVTGTQIFGSDTRVTHTTMFRISPEELRVVINKEYHTHVMLANILGLKVSFTCTNYNNNWFLAAQDVITESKTRSC